MQLSQLGSVFVFRKNIRKWSKRNYSPLMWYKVRYKQLINDETAIEVSALGSGGFSKPVLYQ